VGLTIGSVPALAQPGGGFGRGLEPGVSSRDLGQIEKILAMGDEQTELLHVLHEGYQEQFRARAEAVRQKMREAREKAQETGDWSVMRDLREDFESFADEREAMDSAFMSDVRAILTADQEGRWPKVEMAMHRSQHLGRGLIRGERVDLVAVLDGLEIEDASVREQITPIVDRYEIELDRQLMKRVEVYEDGFRRMGELRRDGDMEGLQELMDKGRDASLRVRDVNERFARQLAGALPGDLGARFDAAVKREAYPDVYRPGHARLSLDAARGFSDLTEDQSARVAALASSFDRDMGAVNEKLVDALRTEEEDATIETMFRRGRGGDRDGPVAEIRRAKRTLDREFVDKLKEILSEDQVERLPEPPRERQGGPGGRFQRGGGGRIDA
jgi:hypothetical protein